MATVGTSDHSKPLAAALQQPSDAATGPEDALALSTAPKRKANPWCILLIVALNTMLNSYMSMNSSAAEDAYVEALGTTEATISGYFSIFLFTVLFGMTPGMLFADTWEGLGLGLSVLLNVTTTWLRYAAIATKSPDLCLISVFVNGAGACTILSLPAQISERRFPRKMATFTTSLAVQANYVGWLVGALIPPQVATDGASLERLCLVQAIVATPLLVLFFILYRPASPEELMRSVQEREEASEGAIEEGAGSNGHSAGAGHWCPIIKLFLVCKSNPAFMLQVLACGLLGGVSFAQPSAAIFILEKYGFSNQVSAFVNVCFITAGVIFGICIGKLCTEPKQFGLVLKVLFGVCFLCSAGCAAIAQFGYLTSENTASLVLCLFLSGGTGLCSLGFLGIGIEATALYPVGAGYVCWAIEIIMQGVGGGLAFWASNANGFNIILAFNAAAFLLMLIGYRLPKQS